ncbi:MAG: deoxyguanosinetriphosphate triphosphohydrolase [Rhodospirillales bacterium]|nr:MAG: deoxyguanosinetriphosphate triphosphohydrolase [Rhodospirillales bacterium]
MSDPLAPYATRWQSSRGRLHAEPESEIRSPFQRDRDRIVHSTAFRRLKHKTQVFISPEGDHFRTRLTHSIEVAQIARTIARCLRLDEDLAEALALAHDLGHTPFAHAGQEALDSVMKHWGGFEHNDQTLRVLTLLEARYANFDGLNLTWETLEGVVKHNGPLSTAESRSPPPPSIAEYNARHDLSLADWPGPEAQVAAIADDIAYNHHDLDDGIRAGLFSIEDLDAVPHVAATFHSVRQRHPAIEPQRLVHETVRRLIDAMVRDVVAQTGERLAALGPTNVESIRAHGHPVVAFSRAMGENDRALKRFLFERLYRNTAVLQETAEARRIVTELFNGLMAAPERLPAAWRWEEAGADPAALARRIADYIAGMTDRYATQMHALIDKKTTK